MASAKEILVQLLDKQEFTKDMKASAYSDVGAACACNPNEELLCTLLFGKGLNTKQGEFQDPMGYVEDREQCKNLCEQY